MEILTARECRRRRDHPAIAFNLCVTDIRVLGEGHVGYYDPVNREDYLSELKKYFPHPQSIVGMRFLDIGSGVGGRLHSFFVESGAKVINVDVVELAVRFRRAVAGEPGIVGSVFRLPILDNSVEGVLSTNLLNSGACLDSIDIEDIFRETHRVIKEGGLFIQSHNGTLGNLLINRQAQLDLLAKVGFTDITVLASGNEDKDSVSFIAKRTQSTVASHLKRTISWEAQDSVGYGGVVWKLHSTITEGEIADFCRVCDHHVSATNGCNALNSNDQARFAYRGRCDFGQLGQQRIRVRRMGVEQLTKSDLKYIET